jgi:hypothetical protein
MLYHSKIIFSIVIGCFFISPSALAQQLIKGQVVNEANKGIASVSIYNKQKLIALSDPEGNFSFKIDSLNKGQLLSFSSVGYESHSVKVDKRSSTSAGKSLLKI